MHWTLIFTQMRKLLWIGRQNTPGKIPFAREVFWKGKENENWENPFSGSHLFNARLSSLRVICIFPNAKPQSIKCTSPSDPRSNLRDSKKAQALTVQAPDPQSRGPMPSLWGPVWLLHYRRGKLHFPNKNLYKGGSVGILILKQ